MNANSIPPFLRFVFACGISAAALANVPSATPRFWGCEADNWRMKRHAAKMSVVTNGGAKVVFVGDSITHGWEERGPVALARHFSAGDYKMLNLGYGGDFTQSVLWRIGDGGELDGYEAKVVVVTIGSNNVFHHRFSDDPTSDVVLGVREVLKTIRRKQPKAKIVLLPIHPCGAEPSDPRRARIAAVNREIMKYADGNVVWWCDFTEQLMTPDGRISSSVMADFVHPGEYGYEIWAAAVLPYVTAALSDGRLPMPPNRYSSAVRPWMDFHFSGPAAAHPRAKFADRVVSFDDVLAGKDWWADRLMTKREEILAAKGTFDVVFLGDSITRGWEHSGRARWDTLSKEFKMLNLGYGGDRTQELIWRMENGELEGYRAKTFVLMIGTNNHGASAPDVAAGIRRVLDVVAKKQPQATTLLLPIFPCGKNAQDANRAKNESVNAVVRKFADGRAVRWLDFNSKFLDANGDVAWIMPDRLHPNARGYDVWAEAMLPILRETAK